MTFALGFYSFHVNLNNATRGVYTSFRVKTPRHPEESLEHLYARVIAYAHSYEEGIEFTQGMFEEKEPTIWKRSLLGETELWLQVGLPERRKLERAMKHSPKGKFEIYFYDHEQAHEFCWMLRGSKENWVEPIFFYEINSSVLREMAEHEQSSSNWEVSFIDSAMYLHVDGRDYVSEITRMDIWDEFQHTIANVEETGPSS